MSRIAGVCGMVAAALLQVTWAPHLAVGGAFPNLVLVAVVAITWSYGARAGMLWACTGGVLLDLTATGPIGPHALALVCGSYLTLLWARNVHRGDAWHAILVAAGATIVYSLILVASDDTLGLPVPALGVAAQLTLTACAYNAVLAVPAVLLARRLGMHAPEGA